MALTDGIYIPKEVSTEKILKDIYKVSQEQLKTQEDAKKIQENIESREERGWKATKTQIAALEKLNKQYKENNSNLEDLVGEDPLFKAINRIFPQKYEQKLQKTYTKHVIKGRYFAASLSVLEGIKEGIENSNWIKMLLGALAFLAVFDPNGAFITSMMNTLVDGFVMILGFILPMIPKIVTGIFKLIPILVNAIVGLIPKLMKGIADALFSAGKEAGGFFGELLKFLSYIAGSDAVIKVLQAIVSTIGAALPLLIGLFVAFKLFTAVMAVLQFLGIGLTATLGWVVLAIAAVISIGYLVYKYWDEITNFVSIGFSYISMAFKGIINFFTTTVPNLVLEAFKGIVKFFTETIPGFIFKYILNPIGRFVRWYFGMWKRVFSFFSAGVNTVSDFFSSLTDTLLSPFLTLKKFVMALGVFIGSQLSNILSFGTGPAPLSFTQAKAVTELSQKTGLPTDRLSSVIQGKGAVDFTKAETQALRQAGISSNEIGALVQGLRGGEEKQVKALEEIKKVIQQGTPETTGGSLKSVAEVPG